MSGRGRVARFLITMGILAGSAGTIHPAHAGVEPMAEPAGTGRPDRLIVIRPSRLELFERGRLVARLSTPVGSLTMPWVLDRLHSSPFVPQPSRWISQPSQGTVLLSSALLLRPGTSLEVGPATRRLLLAGGPDAATSASISGSHARLTIRGVSVTSWQPVEGGPVPASDAGRPYLYLGAGGRLDVIGSTVSNLGRPGPSTAAGVTWGKGSTGSALDARFVGNRRGLQLAGSAGVRLGDVEVDRAIADGLVLRGDRGTTVHGVSSHDNGGDGVVVTGAAGSRSLADVVTASNSGVGLRAVAQRGLVLRDISTKADRGGGVRLTDCVSCTIDGLVAVDEPTAVDVTGPSRDVTVTGVRVRRGQVGIRAAAPARGVVVRGLDVSETGRSAVALSAADVRVEGARVDRSPVGVHVYGKASAIHLTDVRIDRVRTGMHVSEGVTAVGERIHVLAEKTGVHVKPGGRFELIDSEVRAPQPLIGGVVRLGHNVVSLPPFPWLGFVGVVILLSAVTFEAVHRMRQRGGGRTRIPAHVLNT